jgi:hypothetical protein
MSIKTYDENMYNYIQNKYKLLCSKNSDINEHLPTLFKYSKECGSILELGVRGVVSSWALLYGLIENDKNNKHYIFNDISPCNIDEILSVTKNQDIKVDALWMNDLDINLNHNIDLTFIDTWHVYGQLKRELEKFSKFTNKYIIMHDTTVDEIHGELIRRDLNVEEHSLSSGFTIDEISQGLGKAINEFLENNKDWILLEKYTNNNGLTVLKKL